MRKLGIILIVFVAIVSILPIRDTFDDGQFNFSNIKRAVASLDNADDDFINDINRIGLLGEVLTNTISEQKKVDIEYATKNEWDNFTNSVFFDKDGNALYRLRIRTDAEDEEYIYYSTNYNRYTDSWESYQKQVKTIYAPISPFADIWNELMQDNNFIEDFILSIGSIGTFLYMIVYMLIVFLFDSIGLVWELIAFIFKLIGIIPIR